MNIGDLRKSIAFGLRSALLALTVSTCGDDAAAATAEHCPKPRPNCMSDSGLPPEQDPACVDLLKAYDLDTWPQRSEASVFEPSSIPASGNVLAVGFAPEAHSGIGLTAWLERDADLDVRFDLALGASSADPQMIYAVLLLDGIAQVVRHDDATATATPFELHPGQHAKGTLTVPADAIEQGAHSGVLLLWTAHGHPLSGKYFSVLKNSTRFVERPPPEQGDVESIGPNQLSSATSAGRSLLLSSTLPQPDGRLPLSVVVTPAWTDACQSLRKRLVLVAFLDNEQVELGDAGVRPAFELKVAEAMKLNVQLTVPVDESPHTFQLWILTGDGVYAEAPQGESSAWQDFPQSLGLLTWQHLP
jgi:hypothetical protein